MTMKILYAVSEAAPFAKSGGLGDVASSLPRALSRIKGNEVCVIMPYYRQIKNSDANAEYIGRIFVPLAWRSVYAGVFKKVFKNTLIGKNKRADLVYYFIDNEYYFDRPNLYGESDDGERFAFFSKAILESLPLINFFPDIIHTNDWQTGFVPLFLKAHYSHIDKYKNIKTVFTIHNIEYQGKADVSFLTNVLGVGREWADICMANSCVNAMKTAIVLCDALTTVSRTYSHEIRHSYFGEGLSDVISQNAHKLYGIVNGIDMSEYNSETSPCIAYNYTSSDTEGKKRCKKALQEELGLNTDESTPLFVMVTRLVTHKGLELAEGVINEIMAEPLQLAVLGTGDRRFEELFEWASHCVPHKIRFVKGFDNALSHRFYSGGDFLIMPSKFEPCGLSQLIAMRYGCIPIVRETGGLFDTVKPINPQTEEGEGITFKLFNAHDMLDAIRRAESLFADETLKEKVKKRIMSIDWGWQNSSAQYMDIYNSLCNLQTDANGG